MTLSFAWRRPARDEWMLLIPGLLLAIFLMASRISIGFRHALPAYVFLIMLTGRVANLRRAWLAIAWIAVAISAIDVARFHPDYLSYINRPVDRIDQRISDSNLDWGQALKQTREWITRNPTTKPIHVMAFTEPYSQSPVNYLSDRADVLTWESAAPSSGILIISPVWIAGPYDPARRYHFLSSHPPIATIGHSMLVFDLDAIAAGKG